MPDLITRTLVCGDARFFRLGDGLGRLVFLHALFGGVLGVGVQPVQIAHEFGCPGAHCNADRQRGAVDQGQVRVGTGLVFVFQRNVFKTRFEFFLCFA